MKKALSHVKYFNDQSIIEILFEEIMKKKRKNVWTSNEAQSFTQMDWKFDITQNIIEKLKAEKAWDVLEKNEKV